MTSLSVYHFVLGLGSAAATFVLGFPLAAQLIRRKVIDRPNERSSHGHPTARGGGLAIVATVAASGLGVGYLMGDAAAALLVLIAAFVALVSFADDLRPLPPAIRFGCHTAAAVAVLSLLGWSAPGGVSIAGASWRSLAWLFGVLCFLWLTGSTNAFNFMDGINGIAASQAVITGVGGAMVAGLATGDWSNPAIVLSLVVAGAAAGFLPHNFPRARMFMGDVGSAPLGLLLAALVVWMASRFGWWLLVPLGLLHANFVLDTGITLARRLLRGERWYEPHREHFYQRLVRSGRSHTFVTGCEMGLQVLVLLASLLYVWVGPVFRIGLILLVLAIWLGFFAWCEHEFRRARAATRSKSAVETISRSPMAVETATARNVV